MADQQPKARKAAPSGTHKPQGKPISSHPLFPAIVGLWFGALFGLGSLAVRPSLLEALVMSSRIDTILPAAAPPLGVTARILLALILAASGSLLGAWLGRRIARPKPEVRERKRGAVARVQDDDVSFRSRDAHPDAPARRPISAMEEIGFGSADSDSEETQRPPLAGRRRALAIDHDEAFQVHDLAPLPGGAPQILDVTQMTTTAAPEDAPLDLGGFAQAMAEPTAEPVEEFAAATEFPSAASPTAEQPTAAPIEQRQMFNPAPAAVAQTFSPFAAPIEDAVIEPFVPEITPAEPTALAEAPDFSPPASYQPPFSVAPEAPPPPAFKQQASDTPLGDLNMGALADRLAETMRLRRERQGSAASHAAEPSVTIATAAEHVSAELPATEPTSLFAPSPAPTPLFGRPPVEPASYIPPAPPQAAAQDFAPFAPPAEAQIPMPASMRPLSFDDHADDDDDLSPFLPPRHIAMPVSETVEAAPEQAAVEHAPLVEPLLAADATTEDDSADEQIVAEEGYSSLLDIGLPAPVRQSFVRIEEPEASGAAIEPVVIFPGQAARSSAAAAAPDMPASPFAPTFVQATEPPEASDDAQTFRRFDAPTAANFGQPLAAAPIVAQQDPAETERALRAALASLQRMSGAA